ncbi:peptide N-acetyl-beta-D-glucosaminyl asparaginase amidase A-domain-containing protein [Pyrenochaeta sp. MPI-SDFR-AT-0127]|nr:peptide N-acetyl-beta-D-glucosaminyl asparaginase amidase A-domain-containing protein [Pyrenochaeta sp. MPI-SDFR-AT-0127]
MGGNTEYIAGHGYLSLSQAVHVAQNSEGGVDQRLAQFLEKQLAIVWSKLNAQPNTYILPSDEFALMNYYRTRFGDNEIDLNKRRLHHFAPSTFHEVYSRVSHHLGGSKMYDLEQTSKKMPARRNERLARLNMRRSTIRAAASKRSLYLISIFLMLITISHSTLASLPAPPRWSPQSYSLTSHAANESSPLECLQVAPPILSSPGDCQQTLMVHTFAYSYGKPFIGDYHPPNCVFNRVIFNLTVTSAGRQFDRLALMFFDDIEIFRTSTAEPTQYGIMWTYVKDMSSYLSLFQRPQKIIFDLGNLVDNTYTGSWNTTLTATFLTAEETIVPADRIFPISAGKSADNLPSSFAIPETRALNSILLPQHAKKAVFSISACGQAAEEFWWSNVLSSDTRVFENDTTLYGHSPFRELRLLIDGHLAGVAWPFPVIFTGGVVPGFWRPLVGIDAFDLREEEIDITPFVPLLSDNEYHTFEIQVIGIDDDGHGNGVFTEAIESIWVVTGKVFIWLDSNNSPTTGTLPTISSSAPVIKLQSSKQRSTDGTVKSLDYSIEVSRNLHIEATVHSSDGPKEVSWKQALSFSNSGTLSNGGNDQVMRQTTTGTHSTTSGYSRIFEYPLWVISSFSAPPNGNLTINAKMGRGKYVQQLEDLAFPNDYKTFDYARVPAALDNALDFHGSNVNNWQNGTASYISVPAQKRSYGSGSTEQLFSLSGISGMPVAVVQDGTNNAAAGQQRSEELYWRHIVAANDSIICDEENFEGQVRGKSRYATLGQQAEGDGMLEFARRGVRALLGRGRSERRLLG